MSPKFKPGDKIQIQFDHLPAPTGGVVIKPGTHYQNSYEVQLEDRSDPSIVLEDEIEAKKK